MKKFTLILAILFASFLVNAQSDSVYTGEPEPVQSSEYHNIDTAKYSNYTVYNSSNNSKAKKQTQSTSNKINQYATGQSKSQQRTLHENALAAEVGNKSRQLVRTIGAIAVTIVSMAIITKATMAINEAVYH